MKYLVMECSPGYAVLMDEESRVVRAANLHYTVGQTVTDPILMQERKERPHITRRTLTRIAAAAACLLILSTAGIGIYLKNRRTSVVVLVEQKRYEMSLNRSGEVVAISGEDENGDAVVEQCAGKHLTLASAVNTVLQDSIAEGSISEEKPVQIYLSAENTQAYDEYKAEIEQEAAKLQLKAEVQALAPDAPEPPKGPENPPEPPADPAQPPKNNETPPDPPEPGKLTEDSAAAPPEPGELPGPPDAPEPPGDDKPEPPGHEPLSPPEQPETPPEPPETPPAPKITVKPPVIGAEPETPVLPEAPEAEAPLPADADGPL